MIIVNQTRDSVINFNNSQTVDLIGQSIFVHFDQANESCQQIGYYKTEERAKEVFAELIEMLEDGHIEKCRMPEE